MTAMLRPTDSVLRRHFESNFQVDGSPTSPQDSTLVRHHEQMRAAARGRAERAAPRPLPKPAPSLVGRHPLAIHLEMRGDNSRSPAGRTAATDRSSFPQTTPTPPEDSILARHYAQANDVSFAEHPLAKHLRMRARAAQTNAAGRPPEPTSAMEERSASAASETNPSASRERRQNDPSSAGVEDGHHTEPVRPKPNEHGWFLRLLRSITGR